MTLVEATRRLGASNIERRCTLNAIVILHDFLKTNKNATDHVKLPRGTGRQASIGRPDLLQTNSADLTGQHQL